MRQLDSAQVLRGMAALLVYFFHASIFLWPNETFRHLFVEGNIGVNLFFILSGFLMVYTTEKISNPTLSDAKKFIIKRVTRIVPLYYLATAMAVLIYHKTAFYLEHFIDLIKTLLFLPLFYDPIGPTYGNPVLYVGWSLNYEMLFYFLFATSFFFGTKRYLFLFSFFIFFIFILPFYFCNRVSLDPEINYGFGLSYLNILTNPIQLYFVAGIVIGLIVPSINLSKIKVLVLMLVGAIVFALNYFQIIVLINPSFSRFVSCLAFVVPLILLSFRFPSLAFPKFFVYLGDISYSLYLIHPLAIFYVPALFRKFGWDAVTNTFPFLIFVTVLILALSIMSYEWIEKPIQKLLKPKK